MRNKINIKYYNFLKTIYDLPRTCVSFILEQKYKILNRFFKNYGIEKEKRNPPLILSLTSFPARIDKVYLTIETLLRQELKPDYIYLWLSKKEFPNKRKDLPERLLEQEKRGLEIKFCEENLRSYKKLIYTLGKNPNSNIITFDDDIIYPKNIVKMIYHEHKKFPKKIIATRCNKIIKDPFGNMKSYKEWKFNTKEIEGSDLFFVGAGGVLYPRNSLSNEVFNEKVFIEICPSGDDIWFWAMALLNKTKIRRIKKRFKLFAIINSQRKSLSKVNLIQNKNDEQIKKVFKKYCCIHLPDKK